jgi:hypothetical protein
VAVAIGVLGTVADWRGSVASVDRNAFETNSVGLNGSPCPLHVRVDRDDGVGSWRLYAVAVQLRHVADIVVRASGPYAIVYDVGHYDAQPGQPYEPVDLDAVAARRGVAHRALDVEWAGYGPPRVSGQRELIVMRTSDLPALVGDLGHYEFSLLTVAREPDNEQIESMILEVKTSDRQSLLPTTTMFGVRVHDDCYLHAHGQTREQVQPLAGRVSRAARPSDRATRRTRPR